MLDPKCIYRKSIFAKCTRLACLLSFASLFDLGLLSIFLYWHLEAVEHLCISVEGSKYLECLGLDRATVTHTNPEEKETITFK